MSNILDEIFNKIGEKKTANEICDELNITPKQLNYYLNILKNHGVCYKTLFKDDGNILFDYYNSGYNCKLKKFDEGIDIITDPNNECFKAMAIADLHIGSEHSRADLLDSVYEYCVQNNIHIIFCCGDILEGGYYQDDDFKKNCFKQIETFIKIYPYDKNIVTIAVLGNHDFTILKKIHFDPSVIINQKRLDIFVDSYNNSLINLGNDSITLRHMYNKNDIISSKINIYGHRHLLSTNFENNTYYITVPGLCKIGNEFPGALELNLDIEEGYIKTCTIHPLMEINKKLVSYTNGIVQSFIPRSKLRKKKSL